MKWPIFGGLNHHILADLGDPQIFATHFSSTLLQLGPKKNRPRGNSQLVDSRATELKSARLRKSGMSQNEHPKATVLKLSQNQFYAI
jgi:hypothetical protein